MYDRDINHHFVHNNLVLRHLAFNILFDLQLQGPKIILISYYQITSEMNKYGVAAFLSDSDWL